MTPHQVCPTRPVLLCSPVARHGLAADNPDLRSGLPRRFSRGRRCGGAWMNEQSGADGAESLPAPSPDGEPLAEYIARTVKADLLWAVQEDSHITTVQARLRPAFRPAVFSPDAVQRFYEAYNKVDKNADASRYERELYHLWEARDPAALPLRARIAGVPQPDLGDAPRVTVTLVGRFRALTALFEAARTRDLLLGQLCNSLRQGKLQAIGFLADDHAMELKPIPPGRWGDSAMLCAWREGELRPRAGAPQGTPHYRGLCLICPPAERSRQSRPAVQRPKFGGEERMRAAFLSLLEQGTGFAQANEAHVAVLKMLNVAEGDRGFGLTTFYRIWRSRPGALR